MVAETVISMALIIVGLIVALITVYNRCMKRIAGLEEQLEYCTRKLSIMNDVATKFVPVLKDIEEDMVTHGQPDDDRIFHTVKELRILLELEAKWH